MATRRISRATLIDTNVLLDATDVKRPRHSAALALLEERTNLVLSAQVIREYLVVATRLLTLNGLGLGLDAALSNLREFQRVTRLLPEEKALLPTLLDLLGKVPCQGNTIHDALLVATMRAHRIRRLVTANAKHFERFSKWIQVEELRSLDD